MTQLTEDSEVFFVMARKMLVHAELAAAFDSDRFILTSGLGKIATGLEILSAELIATRREIAELKALLQQVRKP